MHGLTVTDVPKAVELYFRVVLQNETFRRRRIVYLTIAL
jgi:hypothetical protein